VPDAARAERAPVEVAHDLADLDRDAPVPGRRDRERLADWPNLIDRRLRARPRDRAGALAAADRGD
jgi:hypothetical protein